MTNFMKAIKLSGLKKTDICKQVNISRTYLFYLENGTKKPSFNVMYKLSKILNKTPQELFFSEDEN
ncbi:helix-turn-helix transcriptional regulator [Clostridium chromiireducens]|uniref:Helix-turn-helix protein n=1 Tax=Clostridium chromiireducens TaxID=225345 RepID=A0A1V4J0C4_9CLOT|nr:helix-turn-helix transcriptional regulator [Clostridium chromiireducens]OPJ65752.1 helix-turn-helix protein [Clostridium chromiireducens]